MGRKEEWPTWALISWQRPMRVWWLSGCGCFARLRQVPIFSHTLLCCVVCHLMLILAFKPKYSNHSSNFTLQHIILFLCILPLSNILILEGLAH